jgi:hypothetical protein
MLQKIYFVLLVYLEPFEMPQLCSNAGIGENFQSRSDVLLDWDCYDAELAAPCSAASRNFGFL